MGRIGGPSGSDVRRGLPHASCRGLPVPGQCERCRVPCVCARHAVTCGGGCTCMCQCLLPITSVGGGGESRAQPSAPTVMFLLPKFPPTSLAPPTPTPRSVSLLLSSIPLPCLAPSGRLQSAPWEGVSHFCWSCPPVPCPFPLSFCSGD